MILDEIGRGTSTFDGLSIAWAVAEYLHDRVGAGRSSPPTTTSSPTSARDRPRVQNASWRCGRRGGAWSSCASSSKAGRVASYGIEVARLAGLPGPVSPAPGISSRTWSRVSSTRPATPNWCTRAKTARDQMMLFARQEREASLLDEELRKVDIDALTPLQALNLLADWKKRLA